MMWKQKILPVCVEASLGPCLVSSVLGFLSFLVDDVEGLTLGSGNGSASVKSTSWMNYKIKEIIMNKMTWWNENDKKFKPKILSLLLKSAKITLPRYVNWQKCSCFIIIKN